MLHPNPEFIHFSKVKLDKLNTVVNIPRVLALGEFSSFYGVWQNVPVMVKPIFNDNLMKSSNIEDDKPI